MASLVAAIANAASADASAATTAAIIETENNSEVPPDADENPVTKFLKQFLPPPRSPADIREAGGTKEDARVAADAKFQQDAVIRGVKLEQTILEVYSLVLPGAEAGLAVGAAEKVAARGAAVAERTITNLTERGTLTNLRVGDPIVLQSRARTLVQDEGGRFWLQSAGGKRITPSGQYDFVRLPDGTIRVARPNTNPEFSTHLGLSGGNEVSYAGSIRFANSNTATRGSIRSWSNNSGHYQPPASLSGNAGLPINLFTPF